MSNVGDPAVYAKAIVPDDANDMISWCRSVYVGGTGNIAGITVGGSTVLFQNVPAGMVLPVQFRRILATGTTATLLIALQ